MMCASRLVGSWSRSAPARWLAVWLSLWLCGVLTVPAWSTRQSELQLSIESRLQDLSESLPAYVARVKSFADSASSSAEEARQLRQELSEQSAELAALRLELESWKQSSAESASRAESLLQKVIGLENRLASLTASFELSVGSWEKAAEAAARRERVWKIAAGAGIPLGFVLGVLAGVALGRLVRARGN
jgi:predicted RNase H-like nuclease (RuvC/YqgF family)